MWVVEEKQDINLGWPKEQVDVVLRTSKTRQHAALPGLIIRV